ncbi:MAG: hypothetical protein KatS3mg051_0219 [Anaerolineae bacterium]|nr:MAG: hypothetical protein KatS3mg051_0219 [Anaerolineae bacterium]
MASVTQAVPARRQRLFGSSILRTIFGSQEAVLLVALVLLIAFVGNRNDSFWATRNMVNVFAGYAYIAIAALGMTMVIITGNIDISVGSLMVTLSMLSGAIVVYDYPSWLPTRRRSSASPGSCP